MMAFHSQETRVQDAFDDGTTAGCSPRHMMAFNSQETGVHDAFDDMASTIQQSLAAGAAGVAAALANMNVNPLGDWTTLAEDPEVLFGAGERADVEMVKRKAAAGDREAQYSIGFLIINSTSTGEGTPLGGEAGRTPVAEQGMAYLAKAAGQGHAYAANMLGSIHHEWREYEQAAKCYARGAEAGVPQSMFNVACMLEKGEGVAAPDYPAAAGWYRAAADAGYAEAAYNMSNMYAVGRGRGS